MAAGVTNKLWDVSDLVALWEDTSEGRKSGVNLNRFFSRTAFIVSGSYAAVEIGLAIYVASAGEPEGYAFAFLIYGFPWSLAALAAARRMPDWALWYLLPAVLFLNTATLYGFAFSIIRMFKDNSK